jgi:hypothetical protein
MRRIAIVFLFGLYACLSGPQPARPRDDRLLREMAQQQRWAGEALAGRPGRDQLDAVRSGDRDAVADARKRWRKLLTAIERTTWIREAAPDALRAAEGDAQAEQDVVAAFDRAAQQREDAIAAAGEVGKALAASRARNALSLEELRKGLQEVRAAQRAEQRLSSRVARPGPDAGPASLQRLSRAAVPPPQPLVEAAGIYVANHPGEQKALDAWPPELAEERTQIRAAAADRNLTRSEMPPAPAENAAPAPQDRAGSGAGDALESESQNQDGVTGDDWSREMKVAADAKKLLAKRGPPASILLRPDGLFALRYAEKRPCGVDECDSTVDYLFDASGRLVRDEVITQKR